MKLYGKPHKTHSLPQSNLAVMCCLTSLMRSWVRWPTSTCRLKSRISFITCQSRWNKSPSFFWRKKEWRSTESHLKRPQLKWRRGRHGRRQKYAVASWPPRANLHREEQCNPPREEDRKTSKWICANDLQWSCCFLPQMYALWSKSIHLPNLISTPDSLICRKHHQYN